MLTGTPDGTSAIDGGRGTSVEYRSAEGSDYSPNTKEKMTGTGEDKMTSRQARYVTLAFLSVQLIAATTISQRVEAHPRTDRSDAQVLRAQSGRSLTMDQVLIVRPNMRQQIKDARLYSGILLTGRDWNMTTLNDDSLSLNPFVSHGHLTSDCRAFFVGHLIKNALSKGTQAEGFRLSR